ncbi:hypothetical protein GCM10027048_01950 [Hymenobacter coalescens]
MPTKTYYLDSSQTGLVTVRWGWFWRNFTVSQGEQVVGQLRTANELKQGAAFTLADGRQLTARLREKVGSQQLELLLEGQPLPGSATHPGELLRQGLGVLLFLAVLNVALGLLAEIGQVEVLLQLGLGYASAATGLVYLGLWWWAKTRLAPAAFYAAIGLLVLDFVAVLLAGPGGSGATSGMFMRFFLGLMLYRGSQGARQLRAERALPAEPDASGLAL